MMAYAFPLTLLESLKIDDRVSTSCGSTITSLHGLFALADSPLMKRFKSVPDLSLKSRWYSPPLSPPVVPRSLFLFSQYLIINLGMSSNFGFVDLEHLPFPVTMSVDWIRVYQPSDSINYTCDPPDFPTQEYINTYIEAYTSQFFSPAFFLDHMT